MRPKDLLTSVRAWWNRPCGGFEVLAIATPLVMSTISWTLMQFIDRTFLMWYSTDAMAAAMPAGCVNFTAICLAMGIASYAGTFVAQYHGAGRHENIGPIVWQGIWIGLACMPLFLLLGLFAPQIFFSVGHTPNIAGLETVYFRRLAWGSAAVVVSAAAAGFFSGRGKTTVVMQVSVVAALLNIGLDYLWIFGHAGFPVGGIAGAGMATSVSEWAKAAIYLGLMFGTDPSRKFGVRDGMRIDAGLMRSLFRFGGPKRPSDVCGDGGFLRLSIVGGTTGSYGTRRNDAGIQYQPNRFCAALRPRNGGFDSGWQSNRPKTR